MRLVLASNNAKKLAEMRSLLAGLPLQLVAQHELGIEEAEEPHPSFIENALAKARHAAAASGGAAMADDSGLCVDALGGAPGVISAHYAGGAAAALARQQQEQPRQPEQRDGHEQRQQRQQRQQREPREPREQREQREQSRRVQDAANNALLLQQLHGVADRRALFISTLVAVRHAADPQPLVAVGRWPGTILAAPRGELGFGYDPLMFIAEAQLTVAEMDAATKNQLSHRARAMAHMLTLLREVWWL
ncbi:MAG: non-canonical purine NTP pyrophosphatase [Rubrivivax sp.]|nr:non-canonical purine NTP pyrophosphatase [Rubrivivax sp.]